MISKLQRPVIYILVLLDVICFIKKFHKRKKTITVLIFSNVLAEFRSPAYDGSFPESELFKVAKNNHRGNWGLVPGFLEFQGRCDVFLDNLVAVLLQLERGGDLLVDGPGKSGHNASSQHSRCQTHCKSTNSSLPLILIVMRLKLKIE